MNVKVELNFDLKKIKLDLSKELNFAGDVVVKDHFTRLEKGLDANQKSMEKLKPATILKKGFDQILVDQDKMRHLVRTQASTNKQFVNINPGKKQARNGVTNAQIGLYHQTGAGRLPKREWFGITKKAEKKCLKLVINRIDRILRNA